MATTAHEDQFKDDPNTPIKKVDFTKPIRWAVTGYRGSPKYIKHMENPERRIVLVTWLDAVGVERAMMAPEEHFENIPENKWCVLREYLHEDGSRRVSSSMWTNNESKAQTWASNTRLHVTLGLLEKSEDGIKFHPYVEKK